MTGDYVVISWPESQELMEAEGFDDNSYLVMDSNGLEDFGPSAYFVDVDWLNEHRMKNPIMREDSHISTDDEDVTVYKSVNSPVEVICTVIVNKSTGERSVKYSSNGKTYNTKEELIHEAINEMRRK